MDSITLDGMEFFGYHGARPEERALGQRFSVGLTVWRDLRHAGSTDDLSATINYSDLYRLVKRVAEGDPRNLIEAVAEDIATQVLDGFPVERVRVSITKLAPPIAGATGVRATVVVERDRAAKGNGGVPGSPRRSA